MSNSDVRSTARSAFGQNRELIDLQCNNLDLRLAPLSSAWAAETGLCLATT
jgi:hypothetical protein